jgi:hypothetical protein
MMEVAERSGELRNEERRGLCHLLERGAIEIGHDVGDGILHELDLVGDGAAFVDGGRGFGFAVSVDVFCGCCGRGS